MNANCKVSPRVEVCHRRYDAKMKIDKWKVVISSDSEEEDQHGQYYIRKQWSLIKYMYTSLAQQKI